MREPETKTQHAHCVIVTHLEDEVQTCVKECGTLRVPIFPYSRKKLCLLVAHWFKPQSCAERCMVNPVSGQYEPLEVVIKSDKRRLPALLDYVRYSDSPAVQAEAIRITAALAGRMANIVDLLLQPPARGMATAHPQSSTSRPGFF
jgi:hypothetical protein